jgi:hypothetical protein
MEPQTDEERQAQSEEIQRALGTLGMSNAEILASDQIIYTAPRKKYSPGYRAGYTKSKGRGTTKVERQRVKAARRLNRRK